MNRDPERGARIAALRRNIGRTQKAMATAVGVGERTYQFWEEGRPISEPNLAALAYEFGVSPEAILYADPFPTRVNGPSQGLDQLDLLERRVRRHEAQLEHLIDLADRITRLEEQVAALTQAVQQLALAIGEVTAATQPRASTERGSAGEEQRRNQG